MGYVFTSYLSHGSEDVVFIINEIRVNIILFYIITRTEKK